MGKRIREIANLLVTALFLTSFSTACAGLNRRVVAPTESFTLLSSNHVVQICASEEIRQDPDFQNSGLPPCATFESKSLASGSIIEHYREPNDRQERSLVLSVAHWCEQGNVLDMIPRGGPREMVLQGLYRIENHRAIEYAIDNLGIQHSIIRRVAIDNNVDVCMLEVERIDAPAIRLHHRNPQRGERVVNMAAPWGYFDPPNIFIDEGLYLGECRNSEVCRIVGEFTLSGVYAGQGSSGSPILVRRGGVWFVGGVIHSVRVAPFGGAYLPMGATVEQIREVYNRDFIPYRNGERSGQTSHPKDTNMK